HDRGESAATVGRVDDLARVLALNGEADGVNTIPDPEKDVDLVRGGAMVSGREVHAPFDGDVSGLVLPPDDLLDQTSRASGRRRRRSLRLPWCSSHHTSTVQRHDG